MSGDRPSITSAAREAYRALCRLEDELDWFDRELRGEPVSEYVQGDLAMLVARWDDETFRKIRRAYGDRSGGGELLR
jgi:hypothetical protein